MIKALNSGQNATSGDGSLRISSLSTSTSAYLSDRVGSVLNATVLSAAPQDGVRGANPAQQNSSASGYRVELQVGNQTLSVASPSAPRRGQTLQLEVLDARTLRILIAATEANQNTQRTGVEQTTGVNAATPPGLQPNATKPLLASSLIPLVQQNLAANLSRESSPQAASALFKLLGQLAASSPTTTSADTAVRNNISFQLVQALQSLLKPLANNATTDTPLTSIRAVPTDAIQAFVSQQPLNRQQALLNAIRTLIDQAKAFSSTNKAFSLTDKAFSLRDKAFSTTNKAFSAANNDFSLTNSAQRTNASASDRGINKPITADNLAQALKNSGLFYEQKLVGSLLALLNRSTQASSSSTGVQSSATANNPTQNQANPVSVDTGTLKVLANNPDLARDNKQQLISLAQTSTKLLNLLLPEAGRSVGGKEGNNANLADDILLALNQSALTDGNIKITAAQKEIADPIIQLLKQIMSQLARTQTQQWLGLGSQLVSSENPVPQTLTFELPFLFQGQTSPIQIYIEREKEKAKKDSAEPEHWALRLRFDIDNYGELTALASLRKENLTAVFWSETTELASRVENELASLKANLADAGLNVANIVSRVGRIDTNEKRNTAQMISDSLLNTKV